MASGYSLNQRIYRWLRKFAISKRLQFSFFVVIFLSITLITVILTYGYYKNAKFLITQNLEEQLDLYDLRLSKELQVYVSLFEQISIDAQFYGPLIENHEIYEYIEDYIGLRQKYYKNQNEINRLLYSYAKNFRMITGLYFITEGDVYAASYPWGERMGKMPESDALFSLMKRDPEPIHRFYIVDQADYFVDADGQSILLMGSVVVRGVDLGLLSIKISADLISEELGVQKKEGANFLLIDDAGTYINDSSAPLPEDILRIVPEADMKTMEMKGYIIASKIGSGTGWFLLNTVNKDVILKSLYNSFLLIMMTTIAILLISFIIALTVTRSISRPIRDLKNEMKRTETNLEFHYDDPYEDEISLLGNNIKQMVGKIKQLIFELHEIETSKKRDMARMKQSQLKALYEQINPHFIYNTLELIRADILLKNGFEDEAAHMISAFSALLRMGTLKDDTLVPLVEELEHTRMYVDVLKFSEYYQNLKLTIRADEDVRQYHIPKLTLQPLVENCVKHGLKKGQPDKEIYISAHISNDILYIHVSDNGIRLTDQKAQEINARLTSSEKLNGQIGLKNINDRIRVLFDDAYGILVSTDDDKKFIVHLPLITKDDKLNYEFI